MEKILTGPFFKTINRQPFLDTKWRYPSFSTKAIQSQISPNYKWDLTGPTLGHFSFRLYRNKNNDN